ncbi:MAG: IS4 family transposase [Bacteroidota bacterium]
MQEGRSVFAQLMDYVPKYEFGKCVERYEGDKHVRKLSCYTQFQIMSFAQLTYRESLRDIETCLKAIGGKLYHTGIRQHVPKSTLADANEKRDWRIFSDFAHVLIAQAVELYAGEPFGADLASAAYALDSTTIDLCLSLFPWAKFRKTKAAVKLHTLLALQGNFPTLVIITPGNVHDVNILDDLGFDPGAFYIMDRGYVDFRRLHRIHRASAFFVTRAKTNFQFRRRYSAPVDKATGIRFDQTVVLTGFYSHRQYHDTLRRIGYTDPDTGKTLIFLTNNMTEPAITVAQLYRCRWQVELFFKWIKQHLRIKSFYGTSANAVKTQIWIAISVYVLIAIVRKRLRLHHSPYTILQILSITLFHKTPVLQALAQHTPEIDDPNVDNQLYFQGF